MAELLAIDNDPLNSSDGCNFDANDLREYSGDAEALGRNELSMMKLSYTFRVDCSIADWVLYIPESGCIIRPS